MIDRGPGKGVQCCRSFSSMNAVNVSALTAPSYTQHSRYPLTDIAGSTLKFPYRLNMIFLGIICPFGDQPYTLSPEHALTPDSSRKTTCSAFQFANLRNQASRSSRDRCAASLVNYNQADLQNSYLFARDIQFLQDCTDSAFWDLNIIATMNLTCIFIQLCIGNLQNLAK
jgi:hypothetical protein